MSWRERGVRSLFVRAVRSASRYANPSRSDWTFPSNFATCVPPIPSIMRFSMGTVGPTYAGDSAHVKKLPEWSVTLEKLFHTVRIRGVASALMCGGLLTASERQSCRPDRRRAADVAHAASASLWRRAPSARKTDPSPTAGASETNATSAGLE